MSTYIVTGIPKEAQEQALERAEQGLKQRYASGQRLRPNFGGPGSLQRGGAARGIKGQRVEVFTGPKAEQFAEECKKRWEAEGFDVTKRRWKLK